MKIEKIIKKGSCYILELDNHEKIKTYDEVILNNNLLFNKELDNELINKIEKETNYYEGYNKILKFISSKMRSEEEIKKQLEKLEIIDKDSILMKLKKNKLINDDAYLKAYVYDMYNLTLNGPFKIKDNLLVNKIDENKIDDELFKYRELNEDRINKLITKKMKLNKKSKFTFKQKVITELINLGYDKEQIISQLNNYNIDDSNNIQRDYDLLYKKLSKKYQDKELFNKIKNKLYQKGYSIDSINELKNE